MDKQPPFLTTESKFPYSLGDESLIHSVLDALCIRDPVYPEGRINSIYYDTRDRRHLGEKVNSDFVKMKVRLRWYGHTSDMAPGQIVRAFLEVKIKNGIRRQKERWPMDIPAEILTHGADCFDELMKIVVRAREFGWVPCGQLYPALLIYYDRKRYVNPEDWANLALDRCITYRSVNPMFWPPSASRSLSQGVLEVKSRAGRLPRALWPIRERLSMKDAFSKYEECWLHCSDPNYQRRLRSVQFD